MSDLWQKIYRLRFQLTAVTFTVLGFYLRIKEFGSRALDVDEVFQLRMTEGAFKPVWNHMANGELTAFPGDYLLKWPFVHFFGTENRWLFTIPHYVATLISFWLFYKIARKYIRSWWGFFFAFIFMTMNQQLIFHALEFRPYAVLPALALGCFYLADELVDKGVAQEAKEKQPLWRSRQLWTGVYFVWATAYHAYGLMIVLACLAFSILKKRPEKSVVIVFKEQAPFLIGLMAFTVPAFLWFAMGNPQFTREQSIERGIGTFDFIMDPRKDPKEFFDLMVAHLRGYKKYRSKLLVYGVMLAWLVPGHQKRDKLVFLMVLIVLPIVAILVSDMMKSYWFLQRQFIWAMPFFALLIGWSWDPIIGWVGSKISKRENVGT